MNSPFDVSFCIPTYNFAKFIGETLDSIIQQADERVQIVIVDGGSTDGTAEIVRDKSRDFPNIKFIQRSQRCGSTRYSESVAQADGEFCWLFSMTTFWLREPLSPARANAGRLGRVPHQYRSLRPAHAAATPA